MKAPSTRPMISGRTYCTLAALCRPTAPAISRSKQAMQKPMLAGFPSLVSTRAATPTRTPAMMTSQFSFHYKTPLSLIFCSYIMYDRMQFLSTNGSYRKELLSNHSISSSFRHEWIRDSGEWPSGGRSGQGLLRLGEDRLSGVNQIDTASAAPAGVHGEGQQAAVIYLRRHRKG